MGGTQFGQQVGCIECTMEQCGILSLQFDHIFLFYFLLLRKKEQMKCSNQKLC